MSDEIIMDNFHFSVTAMGKKAFQHMFEIIFLSHHRATHYSVDEEFGFCLYWAEPTNVPHACKLPYEMDCIQACNFAWGWLENAEYEDEPDHDGSNEKGWTIRTDYDMNYDPRGEEHPTNELSIWGHVHDSWAGICSIQPTWAMQGK